MKNRQHCALNGKRLKTQVRLFSSPSELPQPAGSRRLTARRMIELRCLCNHGETGLRVARLEFVGMEVRHSHER
jgi:hypothetical protein